MSDYKPEWQGKDFYKTLGVTKSSTEDEIKKSYRKLARKYHPDVNPSAEGSDMFKKITEAHEVIGDPAKRKAYDGGGLGSFGGFSGFGARGGTSGFDGMFTSNGNVADISDLFDEDMLKTMRAAGMNTEAYEKHRPSTTSASQENDSMSDLIDDLKSRFKRGGEKVGEKIGGFTNKSHTASTPSEATMTTVAHPISIGLAVNGGETEINVPNVGKIRFRLPKNSANKTVKISGRGEGGSDLIIKPFIQLPDSLNESHVRLSKEFDNA